MAGSFPDNTIFESMQIRSDTNQYTFIDINNNLFGKLPEQLTTANLLSARAPALTHAWEFDLTTKPLTRTEMAPIMAFLTKQNGSAETFEIKPPQTNSRNEDTNLDRKFRLIGAGLNKGEVGTITGIDALDEDSSDGSGVTLIEPGDFLRFDNHKKVYNWNAFSFSVACADFGGGLGSQNGFIYPPAQRDLPFGSTFELNPNFTVALINEPTVLETDVDNVFKINFAVREESYA